MLALALILSLASFAFADNVKFRDCETVEGSSKAEIKEVFVEPCEGAPKYCNLVKGKTAKINVKFTPNGSPSAVKAQVYGMVLGQKIPFPLPNPDGCKDSGLQCPLQQGQTYTYNQGLEIKESYPDIPVTVQWELKDEKDATLVCFQIHVKITNS